MDQTKREKQKKASGTELDYFSNITLLIYCINYILIVFLRGAMGDYYSSNTLVVTK